jgi:hypothetical protein
MKLLPEITAGLLFDLREIGHYFMSWASQPLSPGEHYRPLSFKH